MGAVNAATSAGSRIVILAMLLLACTTAGAATLQAGGGGAGLTAALARAAPGDTVQLMPGVYHVHLILERPVILAGRAGAVLDGDGHGDVVRVRAVGVTLRGLTIRGYGHDLTTMDAGIFVERRAGDVVIRDNRLQGGGFGIWLDACRGPQVINNRIEGDVALRSQDRGNGIHLYSVRDGRVAGNEIWHTRDGIYIDTSQNNVLDSNYLHDLRYGIHYMYSYHNTVSGNRTRDTRTGYALMQSKYLTVTGNRSTNDANYGILMNYITNSVITGNVITGVRQGRGFVTGGTGVPGADGKAIFVYNSQLNRITGNTFADSDIGIHLTAGSEDNTVYGNAFEGNRIQVKYVANRRQEWSHDGRGNYWSDYLGWDMNRDGVGDKPYEPNDGVDKLLWKYPLARVLMNSPAVETLRWVQTQFPVLRPPGVQDSHPLMKPPPVEG